LEKAEVKTFYCDGCGNLVFFENVKCVNCNRALGFLPSLTDLSALEPAENQLWRAMAPGSKGQLYHSCANGQKYDACNWMIPAQEPNPYCPSCRLNDLVPDLSNTKSRERWKKLEMAKQRILYTILRLGLPTEGNVGPEYLTLRFKFAETIPGSPPVITGHEKGLITINAIEADEVERERNRTKLHEPFRTLLGHLRHEIAHFYWDLLIAQSKSLPGFRALFGDESVDYGQALKQYYDQGAPEDWRTRHVSAYASAHPWEDWAETWAHYFHIMDVMETAGSFGLTLHPRHPAAKSMTSELADPFDLNVSFDTILQHWFPVTYALNSINRGMGLPDVYPFVLAPKAIEKLQFIHQLVRTVRVNNPAGNGIAGTKAKGARRKESSVGAGDAPSVEPERETVAAH
jgi:hypothetical protein